MTETDEQRKTRLLISYAWQLVRNAQQRIDDLSADSQDDLYEYHDQERAQLQQWLEFATQAAEELERLQADSDRVNALERITEVNGSVGFYQYDGDWHANVAGKKRAQDRGLRGVLDYLRAWGADRDRA